MDMLQLQDFTKSQAIIACWFIEATVSGKIGFSEGSLMDFFPLHESGKKFLLFQTKDLISLCFC